MRDIFDLYWGKPPITAPVVIQQSIADKRIEAVTITGGSPPVRSI